MGAHSSKNFHLNASYWDDSSQDEFLIDKKAFAICPSTTPARQYRIMAHFS